MPNLPLPTPAGHASRTFIDQKTARPDQVPLLVDHHMGEMETPHQQASGIKNKKTVSKLLTICSLSEPGEK
jgi:hypothetical protein